MQPLHLPAQLLDALFVLFLLYLKHLHVESLLNLLLLQLLAQPLNLGLQRLHLLVIAVCDWGRRCFEGLWVFDWEFFGSIRYTLQ